MPNYIVQQGDCLSSIAYCAGFLPATIWDHPANSKLKSKRKDPNILLAGDELFIPELQIKEYSKPTDQSHKFIKKGVPALLRLQIFDGEEPRANQNYILIIDGFHVSGVTDDQGKLEQPLIPNARKGMLTIGPDQMLYDLDFGHLDPVGEVSGVQGRLTNLGYDCGEVNGELNEPTRAALRAFQRRLQLEQTGEMDEPTLRHLEKLHDRVSLFPESSPAASSDAGSRGAA
jgi:hypothetical protein